MFSTVNEPSCAQRTALSTIELSVNLAALRRPLTPSVLERCIAWFRVGAWRRLRSLEVVITFALFKAFVSNFVTGNLTIYFL